MEGSNDENTIRALTLAIENGQNVLLHGCGGSGKTYLIRELAKYLTTAGKVVVCTATTGIAAMNLSVPEASIAGCTLHSWSGIGLGDAPAQKLEAKVRYDGRAKKRWMTTDILIVDEISMMGASLLDKLDYIGRSIRRCNLPFGGIQFVFSGDFLQLPPVKDRWAFQSMVWSEAIINTFILEEPKRYQDRRWFEMLLRFRRAIHTPEDIKFLRTRVKAYDVYLDSIAKASVTTIKPTILFSKKIDVDAQNDQELDKLRDPARTYIAEDAFTPYNSHAKYDHYIKPLDDTIPKAITLKKGAQVMLKANLDIEAGLANGSRGVVVEIIDSGVKVKWMDGTTTIVTQHTWTQEDKDGKASRSQMPLILAWSLTIHKCQGSTLDYAIVDVGPSVFCPGQAYVALSRVRSSEGLLLADLYPASIKADEDALNFVEGVESDRNVPDEDTTQENIGSDGRYSDPRGPHVKMVWEVILVDE